MYQFGILHNVSCYLSSIYSQQKTESPRDNRLLKFDIQIWWYRGEPIYKTTSHTQLIDDFIKHK